MPHPPPPTAKAAADLEHRRRQKLITRSITILVDGNGDAFCRVDAAERADFSSGEADDPIRPSRSHADAVSRAADNSSPPDTEGKRTLGCPGAWAPLPSGDDKDGPVQELLPTRGDEDLVEATDTPIFLIQRKVIRYHRGVPYHFDGEHFVDDGEDPDRPAADPISDARLLAEEHAFVDWDTQRVGFTRWESELWAERNAHNGPFRVFSVPAVGQMRIILRRLSNKMPAQKSGSQ